MGERRWARAAVLAVVAVTATLLVLVPRPAAACTCAVSGDDELLAQADAAFVGTALSRRESTTSTSAPTVLSGAIVYTFAVEEVVKGTLGTGTREVRTASNSAACGTTFDIGQRYLVLAHRTPDGDLHTSLCSGSRPASERLTTTTVAPPTTVAGRPAASPGRLRLTG
ncbi:MAG: hypothetical protein ACLGI2_06745 [Acidimicrobiia bacterium]